MGCSFDWSIDWLCGCSIEWLTDCSIVWSIDWLIGWLILAAIFSSPFFCRKKRPRGDDTSDNNDETTSNETLLSLPLKSSLSSILSAGNSDSKSGDQSSSPSSPVAFGEKSLREPERQSDKNSPVPTSRISTLFSKSGAAAKEEKSDASAKAKCVKLLALVWFLIVEADGFTGFNLVLTVVLRLIDQKFLIDHLIEGVIEYWFEWLIDWLIDWFSRTLMTITVRTYPNVFLSGLPRRKVNWDQCWRIWGRRSLPHWYRLGIHFLLCIIICLFFYSCFRL